MHLGAGQASFLGRLLPRDDKKISAHNTRKDFSCIVKGRRHAPVWGEAAARVFLA